MKFLFILVCCSLPIFGENAQISFAQATQLAQSGKFKDAIIAYEKLVADGHTSSAILYNLGNCYHSSGDHGRAILAYERARLLTPHDSDLLENLELSRKAANVSAAPSTQRFGGALADSLSRNEWSKLLIISSWISALCVTLVFLRRSLSSSWKKALIACAVLFFALIALASWSLRLRKNETTRGVVITKSSLLLSPFSSAEVRSSCDAGSIIDVQQQHQDYYFVNLLGTEISGWISKREFEKIAP